MTLAELAGGPPLDAAIIGGINGTAIALDLARRGLNVALFEQDDFGFGTTWRSTRLIHGGLRYLEHGDVRLVFESLRERAWLLKARPYLVRPQRFILPVLPWTRRPAWQLRAGLTLYDMLALYRACPRTGASGGSGTGGDARAHAGRGQRLRLLRRPHPQPGTARAGDGAGGAAVGRRARANHATVTGIGVEGGRVRSVEVECEGTRMMLAANLVINVAGPWVDAVNRLSNERAPELLGVTRGTHIVVELPELFPHDALFPVRAVRTAGDPSRFRRGGYCSSAPRTTGTRAPRATSTRRRRTWPTSSTRPASCCRQQGLSANTCGTPSRGCAR